MLLSAVYVLVVAQSIFEIPEGLMNNPVLSFGIDLFSHVTSFLAMNLQQSPLLRQMFLTEQGPLIL